MRTGPSAIWVVGAMVGFTSCQGDTQFKGTGKLGGSIDASRAKVVLSPGGLNQAVSPGAGSPGAGSPGSDPADVFVLPCEPQAPLAVSTKATALQVPLVCSKEETMPGPQYADMDMVFVLDTTGSMQPYVKIVRDNIQEISTAATRNGYTVRFGAISFGDEIYDTQPLTEDAAGLMAAMADTNPKWKPENSRGGLASEMGLGALEAGVAVLQAGTSHSKTLVYFSDGPAKLRAADRDSLESSFAIDHSVGVLSQFARDVQEQSGMFRLISGTSCTRGDSWYPEWPTPCLQIAALAQSAGVRQLTLTFPMTNVGYDEEFVARVESKPTQVTSDCTLDSLLLKATSGEVLLPEVQVKESGAAGGYWAAPVEGALAAGEYQATVKRSCKGKSVETAFSISVK